MDKGVPPGTDHVDPSVAPASVRGPGTDRLRGLWHHDYRNEALALVALATVTAALPFISPSGPGRFPLALLVIGLVPGASLAMQSMGVVLVFRSNQFINFGQVYIGSLAAAFFVLMVNYTPIYDNVASVCTRCLDPEDLTRGQWQFNYWVSFALALGLALLTAWLMYVLVVRRFERQSRLLVTVASIFVGSAVIAIIGLLRNTLTTVQDREDGLLSATAPLPYDVSYQVGGFAFSLADLLTVGIGIVSVALLTLYLRRSRVGRAIRASADNPARAELLGIDVHKVHARVWFIVGFLTGVPALLAPMGGTPISFETVTVGTAMQILLVAVFARFNSLPMAGAASLVIGVLQATTLYSFENSLDPYNGAMVVLVGGLLLLRARERSSRADVLQAATLNTAREVRPIPAELRSLPAVRTWTRTLLVVAVVGVLALPWTLSPGQTNLAAIPFILAIVGLSLLVLTGWAGQISLGQFAFAAIGGYVVATWQVHFVVSLLGGAVLGAMVAALVGIPALRLKGLYLAISTMALAVSVTTLVVSPRYLGSRLPANLARPALFGMDLEDQRTFYYVCLVVLVAVVLAVRGLRDSRTGRVLIASRENEQAIQAFGVSLVRARLTAFAISGFFAALAGGLFAFHQHGVPLNSFDEVQSLDVFTMTVIGGLGSISGPLIGATYTGVLLVFDQSPAVTAFFLGFGGLGLLLLAPGGLSQLAYGLRDAFLRRVAKRHRLIVPSLVADASATRVDGRVPLSSNLRTGGATAFVPRRYEPPGQWAIPVEETESATTSEDFVGIGSAAGQP